MRNIRWTALAVLVAGLIFAPSAVWASNAEEAIEKISEASEASPMLLREWVVSGDSTEEIPEQPEGDSELLGDKRFFVMPFPIANPTIGTGVAGSAMYLFQTENAPPSSVSLMGFYTDSKSWAGALGTETYFEDDKYRLSGWVGYYDINLKFFGIGSGSGDRGQSIGINQNGTFLASRFLFQMTENLYLGPQYRLVTVNSSLQDPISPGNSGVIIPKDFESVSSGLGVVLEYDTRDNRFFPYEGSHLEGTVNLANDLIGSDRNYEQVEVDFNLYRELSKRIILAWRATGCFRGGNTPFYDLCMFGGEFDAIRGYVGGQYRDDVSLTTQLEFRWQFYKKWGIVGFAGIGEVAPTVGDMNRHDLLPSIGVGLRFMASEKERINLGIDYARGKNSEAWYFRIGEAF